MKQKIKLSSAAIGLFTFVTFTCQTKPINIGDSTSIIENQAGQVTDWKEYAPTTAGWRTVHTGMTIDELINALPGVEARTKKVSYTDGTTGQQTSLKKKVEIDGLNYKVSFLFDSDGHLIKIALLCNSKVKKETFSNIVNIYTVLLGEPTNKEAHSYPDGSQDIVSWTWKQTNSIFSVLSGTFRSDMIVIGRLIIVSMYYSERQ